jgi:hypothetical protein
MTEGDLDEALTRALANLDTVSILNVRLAQDDISPALERLTMSLRERL